jgi:hypothetical protein
MKLFSYVVARDYGFAPNPFGKYCTLATCKPEIRRHAEVGDWILGTGSKTKKMQGKIVFLMEVNYKLDFMEYWEDERFQYKKPFLNKSLKFAYGDNIYHRSENGDEWIQENSHHSNIDGTENLKNKQRDTSTNLVLVSNNFYYFGREAIDIPREFLEGDYGICHSTQGYRNKFDEEFILRFLAWIQKDVPKKGKLGDPLLFENFDRYGGPR